MKKIIFGLSLALAALAVNAEVGDSWVNLGGVSVHPLDKHENDLNPGLGYERQVSDKWIVMSGYYYNSLRNNAYYIGGRYIWKKDWLLGGDLGAGAMVVTGYQNNVNIPTVQPYVDLCWKYGCLMTVGYVTAFNVRIPLKAF